MKRAKLVASMLPLLTACAEIQRFDVQPRLACPGDEVHLSWEASGSVTLEPPLESGADLASVGSAEVRVNPPTHFTLRAHRLFKSARVDADIELAPAKNEGFAEAARCDPTNRTLEATFVLDLQLPSTVLVAQVCNPSERVLVASKDGHEVRLAPSEPDAPPRCESEVPEHLAARGQWLLRSPLDAGETCEAALRSVRQRLGVTLQLECGG